MDEFHDFVGQLLGELKEGGAGGKMAKSSDLSFSESVEAFVHAVDWKEPFILSVLAFHACFLVLTISAFRGEHRTLQRASFVLLLLVVYFAERLNAYGNEHWRLFATQNYFDRHGIFISAFLSFPLLMLGLLMVIYWVCESAQLLIKIKRRDLREKIKADKKGN